MQLVRRVLSHYFQRPSRGKRFWLQLVGFLSDLSQLMFSGPGSAVFGNGRGLPRMKVMKQLRGCQSSWRLEWGWWGTKATHQTQKTGHRMLVDIFVNDLRTPIGLLALRLHFQMVIPSFWRTRWCPIFCIVSGCTMYTDVAHAISAVLEMWSWELDEHFKKEGLMRAMRLNWNTPGYY